MSLVLLAICAALSVLGLGFGIVSLLLHWKRPSDANADVASLQSQLHALQTDMIDLTDKVSTWVKRDRVRTARSAKQEQEPTPTPSIDPNASPQERKAALRRIWRERQTALNLGE